MNTKKMLPLFVLVPVVVVLGVALGVLNHADTEEENTSIALCSLDADSVTAIAYKDASDGATLESALTKTDDTWTLDSDPALPLDQSKAQGIADSMTALTALRELGDDADVASMGCIQEFDPHCVCTTTSLVNASGIHPMCFPKLPGHMMSKIYAAKEYEKLAVEAAVTGSYHAALEALVANPLVNSYYKAKSALNELLVAEKEWLPNFADAIAAMKGGVRVINLARGEIVDDEAMLAALDHHVTRLALAGGVSANSGLRAAFEQACQKAGITLYLPQLKLCGDNAAMIGSAAYYRLMRGEIADLSLNAKPALRLV